MILRTMTKMTKILLKVRQSTKISIMWWDMSGSSKAGTRHWTLITDKWTARHYNVESHILYFSFNLTFPLSLGVHPVKYMPRISICIYVIVYSSESISKQGWHHNSHTMGKKCTRDVNIICRDNVNSWKICEACQLDILWTDHVTTILHADFFLPVIVGPLQTKVVPASFKFEPKIPGFSP